jgi:hypothetical protein
MPSDILKEWGGLLAGIAGVLTAIGALAKSCDHSVTQSAYNTLSDSITKLSDQQQKDHGDLANLRGYLDGLSHAPMIPVAAPTPSAALSPAAAAPAATKPLPAKPAHLTAAGGGPMASGSPVQFNAPPVPTVNAAFAPVRAPDFGSIK